MKVPLFPNTRLVLSFESGRVEAGVGSDGEWWFSFFTDTAGSYMAADVSEAVLRALLAFTAATKEGAGEAA